MDNKASKKPSKAEFIIETVIIVLIAIGMVFLNTYTQMLFNKLVSAGHSAVFVKDDIKFNSDEEFAEQLKEYLPDAYKMIELYDENLDLLFQIQFNDSIAQKDSITKYPQIMDILISNEEGQTTIMLGDTEQNVFFNWLINNHGERRLLLVYSSIEQVEGIWIYNMISYFIILMVLILLILFRVRIYRMKMKEYNDITNLLKMELSNKP